MTLGGVDIYSLELCWYRKQVAVFEQDVELFTGSVAYNILKGGERERERGEGRRKEDRRGAERGERGEKEKEKPLIMNRYCIWV